MTDSIGVTIAFGAGVLSFLSPCVLPLVPSYLSFVTGMSLEDLQEGVDRRATLIHALLFVAVFTGIFLLLGASASFLGQFFKHKISKTFGSSQKYLKVIWTSKEALLRITWIEELPGLQIPKPIEEARESAYTSTII